MLDQVDHPAGDGVDTETLTLNLSPAIVATDHDRDPVSLENKLQISVEDDIPVNIDPDDTSMANVAGTVATESLDYFGNVGADEPGTVKFLQSYDGALLLDNDGDPVQSEGKNVVLQLSPDGTVLQGYLEGSDYATDPVIRITLDPDGDTEGNDTYTVELFKKIDDGSGIDFSDFSKAPTGNKKWIGLDGDGSNDLLITAVNSAKTVNNDSDDIAVGDQWIDNGEGIRLDFVQGLDTANGLDESDNWNNVPAPFDFDTHNEANSFEFSVVQVQSGGTASIRISAVDADDDVILDGDTDDTSVFISASDIVVESTGTITITQAGNDVIITGLETGDKVFFTAEDSFDRVIVTNNGGGDPFTLGGFGIGTVKPGSPVSMDFDVEVTDADGDTAQGDFTVTLDSPVLVVGKNVDDVDGQTEDHAVPNPNLDSFGEITGGSANDILIGDIGGSSVQGKDLNLVLVLDTSGSMTKSLDGSPSRIDALKSAVNDLLDDLSESDAVNVRVHIVEFSGPPDSVQDSKVVGTYDVRIDGIANTAELNDAKADVNGLAAGGGTNYEAGLQQAIDWWDDPANQLDGKYLVNQTIFVSDGSPTLWYAGDSTSETIGPAGFYHPDALEHITGTHTEKHNWLWPFPPPSEVPFYKWSDPSSNWQDTVSEVDQINSYGVVESVAIDLPDDSPGLDILDVIEGQPAGSGVSDNITSAGELTQVLQDVSPLNILADTGGDTIVGNEGGDIIFGDALFTDTLAASQGLDMNPGSGYRVFRALENGESTISPDWSRDDTINYISSNMEELSQESVTSEGTRQGANDNISGGDGNDVIYGQEGTDVIHGDNDNDYLDGGSGADELYGDDGDDMLVYDSADTVVDGGAGTDILRLENGDDIDFDLLAPNPIDNIEVIDLGNDAAANSLSNLSAQDVLDMTDGDNELFIIGNSSDTVSGGGWSAQGTQDIGGVDYDVYTAVAGSETVTLYVQDSISAF